MNCRFIVCFIFLFFVKNVDGKIIEQNVVQSKILNKQVSYSIYLPDGYDVDNRSYPVIYLLHGYGGNHTDWVHAGNIGRYADIAIKEGVIPPVVIIMPDGGVSMYVNSYDGKNNYEDFFIRELMPTVENNWRIKKEKFSRGIAGLSMGGWGAMLYALKYPDLFVASAPLSAGIHDDHDIVNYDDQRWEVVFGSVFGPKLKEKSRLNDCWYKNSILKIVETIPSEQIKKVDYRISCGDQDYLRKGSLLLHLALSEKKIHHQFRIKGGDHNWDFWRSDIMEALVFICNHFW
jgi:S-formylglutathione hydrolase FrmB